MSVSDKHRLPGGVKPENYNLLLRLDFKSLTFTGSEEISIGIAENTSEIILNSKGLEITGCVLTPSGGKDIKGSVKMDEEHERINVSLPEQVKGKVKLSIEFSGKLRDDLVGLYKSTYKGKDGSEQVMATTQFEASHARMAFPCFDEPVHKATFDLTVVIDKDLQAVSNMPVKTESAEGGMKRVQFMTSPRMSTYLLYLGVGKFEFLEDKLGDITLRAITVEGKRDQGKFGLDITKKFLSYFIEYSGIPYPLPKLDVIAIPDFAAGAMENWGAITFREVYLLFDPKATSEAIRKQIALIISHELWHMWSGDLVTMEWWNDLWLNESFATYVAYKAVDHYFPEWNVWEDFVSSETESAIGQDTLKTTHPIEVEIKDPGEVREIFDAISYSKGGSILRMLDHYLGQETFRNGVHDYLSKHEYGNAKAEDFWNSLAKFSDKPVTSIMTSWIKTAGHPIVEAEVNGSVLKLKQRRFIFDLPDGGTVWPVPMVIKLGGTENPITELFDSKEKEINLAKEPEWVNINHGQTGFYRVKYSDKNIAELKKLISSKNLPPIDRWGLQNDMFRLSMHGEVALETYLDLITAYADEDDYLVLSSIHSSLYQIYFIFSQDESWKLVWPKFKEKHSAPYRNALKRLGFDPKEGESHNDTLLRETVLRHLVLMEDKAVIDESKKRYEKYLTDSSSLHPDIRRPVLFAIAYTGDEKTYDRMVELYRKSDVPEEKRILLRSTGQFRGASIAKKALDFYLTKEVRTQDLPLAVSSAASNPESRSALLPWLKSNWKDIKKHEEGVTIFTHILESVISAHTGKDKESEMMDFLTANPIRYKMAVNRAFERMRRNTQWLERNRGALVKYFS